MSRNTFERLVQMMVPYLSTSDSSFRQATPVECKVAVAVYTLARGVTFHTAGELMSMGRTSAAEYFHQFTYQLVQHYYR